MKHPKLNVEKRKVTGKKVKKLRKEGVLPGNIYGPDIKSISVSTKQKDFENVFKEAGETGLVDLYLEEQRIPVLIHNVQTDYLNNPLHADFYKVNLKEKVKAMVPLEFMGEPKAVSEKVGLLMEIHSEVEVEALPEALPEKIEVNVENLAAVDDQITVADLKAGEGVAILTDPGQVVAKIGELVTKEVQEEAEAEEAAAEEAKAEEAAAAEGEGAAEGETKEEKTAEEKPQETREEGQENQ